MSEILFQKKQTTVSSGKCTEATRNYSSDGRNGKDSKTNPVFGKQQLLGQKLSHTSTELQRFPAAGEKVVKRSEDITGAFFNYLK